MNLLLGSAIVADALIKGLLVGLAIGGVAAACAQCVRRRNSPKGDAAEAEKPA